MLALQRWQRGAFRPAFLNLAFLVKYSLAYGTFERPLESDCPVPGPMVGFPPTMEDCRSISHRIFCYLFTLSQATGEVALGREVSGTRRWTF